MKTVFSCTILIFFLTQISFFAQTNNSLDYLVLNSGDTLYGKIKYVDKRGVNPKYYKKIRYTDTYGRKKKYKMKNVSSIKVNNTVYESFWLHQSSKKIVFLNPKYDIDLENGEQFFLKVVSKGRLSHYVYEWWDQGDASKWQMDLLKKEQDQFFMRATQGLLGLKRKILTHYFLNCTKLKEQIEHRKLKKVIEVVDFYNSNCVK